MLLFLFFIIVYAAYTYDIPNSISNQQYIIHNKFILAFFFKLASYMAYTIEYLYKKNCKRGIWIYQICLIKAKNFLSFFALFYFYF